MTGVNAKNIKADVPLSINLLRTSEKIGGKNMNSTDALKLIAQDSVKEQAPEINIGSTVKVHVKIREGNKERIQVFEGIVIARRGSGVSVRGLPCPCSACRLP